MDEPKDVAVAQTAEEKVATVMDEFEKGSQEESSASKDTPTVETPEAEEAGADQQIDEKATEAKEVDAGKKEDPKDLLFRKAYNEGRQKALKDIGLSKEEVDGLKQIIGSKEYIELAMKSKGYTQEAIDTELVKRGFNVPERPGDDVQLIINKLGLDPKAVDENTRATIADIAKIADVLMQDRLNKVLPKSIKPLEDNISEIRSKESAIALTKTMRDTVKNEGILDFEKDIMPDLDAWIDENKAATQNEILEAFKDINHRLTIERLRTGKKKVERDEKKVNNRSSNNSQGLDTGNAPKRKEGQSVSSFIDDLMEHHGVK